MLAIVVCAGCVAPTDLSLFESAPLVPLTVRADVTPVDAGTVEKLGAAIYGGEVPDRWLDLMDRVAPRRNWRDADARRHTEGGGVDAVIGAWTFDEPLLLSAFDADELGLMEAHVPGGCVGSINRFAWIRRGGDTSAFLNFDALLVEIVGGSTDDMAALAVALADFGAQMSDNATDFDPFLIPTGWAETSSAFVTLELHEADRHVARIAWTYSDDAPMRPYKEMWHDVVVRSDSNGTVLGVHVESTAEDGPMEPGTFGDPWSGLAGLQAVELHGDDDESLSWLRPRDRWPVPRTGIMSDAVAAHLMEALRVER